MDSPPPKPFNTIQYDPEFLQLQKIANFLGNIENSLDRIAHTLEELKKGAPTPRQPNNRCWCDSCYHWWLLGKEKK